MSTRGSSTKAATLKDLVVLVLVGAVLLALVATQVGARAAVLAAGAYCIVAFVILALRYDARETAAEAANRDRLEKLDGWREEPTAAEPQERPEPVERDRVEPPGAPQATVQEEESTREAAVATQTISPALYGTGIVDEVSGQLGQVNLLETGLNVLAKVDGKGTIDEVNEGMEVVTGVPREDLVGTNAFSYFTDPGRAASWFEQAMGGSPVRDKEVDILHREGETTPLTYNVIASFNRDGASSGGVLLLRYRED